MFEYTDIINSIFDFIIEINANIKKVYRNENYSEKTLILLMDFLENHDFPIECFDLQCPVSKYFASSAEAMTPDLTIINPKTMQPLAFFRTYDSEDDFIKDKLFDEAEKINKCSDTLLAQPYYIVIKKSESLQFYNLRSLFSQTHNRTLEPQLALSEPIKFVVLQNNDYYRNMHNKIIDKNKLQTFGKISFSIIVPLISAVLLILDKFAIFELTNLRLIVFGIAIISILIPYLTQISIKDFSIIFKEKNEAKDK